MAGNDRQNKRQRQSKETVKHPRNASKRKRRQQKETEKAEVNKKIQTTKN